MSSVTGAEYVCPSMEKRPRITRIARMVEDESVLRVVRNHGRDGREVWCGDVSLRPGLFLSDPFYPFDPWFVLVCAEGGAAFRSRGSHGSHGLD